MTGAADLDQFAGFWKADDEAIAPLVHFPIDRLLDRSSAHVSESNSILTTL